MKPIRCASVVALAATLSGCGHGFEGEYRSKANVPADFLYAFADSLGSSRITVGSDYIETNGHRTKFEDIYVRQSGDNRYLVFRDGRAGEAWEIVDDKTLIQGDGPLQITLTRID